MYTFILFDNLCELYMHTLRICQYLAPLATGVTLSLDEDGYGHLVRVMRKTEGESFYVFDGQGHEFAATLTAVNKKEACYLVGNVFDNHCESPLHMELGQVISRGDRMEFTIQKACELGISSIRPLLSERCGVKLTGERLIKKVQQWQKIAIAACEQCGRATVPKIDEPISLIDYFKEDSKMLKITLDPKASLRMRDLTFNTLKIQEYGIKLLIGSEGGLSSDEINLSKTHGFIGIGLGPRILRTETASLCTLSLLGALFGDL